MSRRKATYEVSSHGRLLARGPIELVADALFVRVGTARKYACASASRYSRKGVDITRLDELFSVVSDKGVVFEGSAPEVAGFLGTDVAKVVRYAYEGSVKDGMRVRREAREVFLLPEQERVRLLYG